jgi:hypothetical protein
VQVPATLRTVKREARRLDQVRGVQLSHFCVERLDAQPARHGHPVVTVADEVGVADLQQAHRRRLFAPA